MKCNEVWVVKCAMIYKGASHVKEQAIHLNITWIILNVCSVIDSSCKDDVMLCRGYSKTLIISVHLVGK